MVDTSHLVNINRLWCSPHKESFSNSTSADNTKGVFIYMDENDNTDVSWGSHTLVVSSSSYLLEKAVQELKADLLHLEYCNAKKSSKRRFRSFYKRKYLYFREKPKPFSPWHFKLKNHPIIFSN